MGSLNKSEVAVAGVGMDFYQWMLGVLTSSRSRGGGGGYRRLHQPVRKRVRLARLGGKRRIRALRIKSLPRLRLRLRLRLAWFSPFTLLAKLRDAYVKLLQSASDKFTYSEGLALGPFPGFPSDAPLGDLKTKEREMDKVLELYLSRTRPQLLLTNED